MARFDAVQAAVNGTSIDLRFTIDSPGVLGWQVFDPETGAFLFEGEWARVESRQVDLRIDLPSADGPYCVRVAPVEDRTRFIQMDAQVQDRSVQLSAPRVTSERAIWWQQLRRAIPKAISYPLRSVWQNRRLIQTMVRRDILSRYRGSFGGTLWSILNPLLLMSTYFFVFGIVFTPHLSGDSSRTGYVLYFLAGMLPWMAFAEAVGRSPYVIVEHRNFVKKLLFPLETLPVNLVISGVVTEIIGLVIFLVGLLLIRKSIPWTVVWLPALLLPQLLLTAGLCWFLAALGVFVRDLGQIIGFILTLWLYLTPIFYAETQVPAAAAGLLSVNPMWALVRGYRSIFLESRAPDAMSLGALWLGSVVVALAGYAWFHRLRRSFADTI
jgi:lipopolysaccharide transport system permease protein